MNNKDQRYLRYQNNANFNQLVNLLESLIYKHNFTHQDLQDACFVAYMKFLELNPIPLSELDKIKKKDGL